MLIQEEATNMEEQGLRAEESISLSHGLIRTTNVVLSVEMKGTGKEIARRGGIKVLQILQLSIKNQ